MNKKNEALDQEKEQLFLTYQKKIEELQSKVLDNTNNNSKDEEIPLYEKVKIRELKDRIKKGDLKEKSLDINYERNCSTFK